MDNLGDFYDQAQIINQTEIFNKVIQNEISKFGDKNSKRIFLGGFSQGAMLALSIYLRNQDFQLGGLMGFSGQIPLTDQNRDSSPQALDI